ncbi:MAG TPA: MMPL family transporter [Deltaproteobacteria bacterium]|nr:MMPL family transporter [Deltaproteobacteria bacterium]
MERFAHLLFRLRYALFGLILAVTVFFGLSIRVEMDNTISSWFSPTDPVSVSYRTFRDTFEGSRYLIVAVRSEDLFTTPVLTYLKRKTQDLKEMTLVKHAYSMANANKILGTEAGIEVNPLLKDVDTADARTIREQALTDELFVGNLVSENGTLATIVLVFDDMNARTTTETIARIEDVMGQGRPDGVQTFLSGDIMVNNEFNKVSEQNGTVLPIIGLLVVVAIIFSLFRSAWKIAIAVSVIALSLCWTMGLYSLLGYTFNALSGMIMPLIIILSVSNTIHMMEYYDEVRESSGRRRAYINTLTYITVPCFNTAITTAFGLLSLTTSSISTVRHFGLVSAAGILFAFFISVCTVPLLLTFSRATRRVPHPFWGHLLALVNRVNERHTTLILFITALAVAVAIGGITRLTIETNELEWFPDDSEMNVNAEILDKELSGIGTMEVIVEGEPEAMKQPEILARMDTLSRDIRTLPQVRKVISLADYVKALNRALNGGDPEAYRVPDSRELIAQELLLFSFSETGTEELERISNNDFSRARVSVKLSYSSSEEGRRISGIIMDKARNAYAGVEGVKLSITGSSYLLSMLDKYIVESQIRSITLSFILVFGILFLILWSVKFGLLSMLPNIIPIVLILGIMGWMGIHLNVGTVMISSIALGIAVDDTIHMISRFRKEHADGTHTVHSAMRRATIMVGKAVIFTSLINMAGFSVVVFSDFQPSRDFGFLLAVTMFIALLCDLFFLTSCILKASRFIEKTPAQG